MENKCSTNSNGIQQKKLLFSNIVTDEVFNKHLEKNNALCYVSGTGSGKSYWVKNHLRTKGRVLFVTSRKAKVNEDNRRKIYCSDLAKYKETSKSFLVTNSNLAQFIKSMPLESTKKRVDEFLKKIKYIVVDEIHSIICDSTFSNDVFTVQKFIEYAAFEKRMPVILLTATDQLIEDYLNNPIGKKDCYWERIDLIKDSVNIIPPHIEKNKSGYVTDTLIPYLVDNGKKFVYFLKSENEAKNIIEICTENNNEKRGSIFIKNKLNKTDILYFNAKTREKADNLKKELLKKLKKESKTEKLKFDYDKNGKLFIEGFSDAKYKKKSNELAIIYLSEKSELPPHIKILLATSALKEGISINNKDLSAVICYSHSLSDLLQYMGRVREGNYSLHIIEDAIQFPSGICEIAYRYSRKEGVDSVNKFILTLNEEEKRDLIEFIEEKNLYIKFNYLDGKFELNELVFSYQKYLDTFNEKVPECFGILKWEKEISDFFDKYGFKIINYKIDNKSSKYSNSFVKKAVREILELYGNRWLRSNEWKEPKKQLETVFDLSSINKEYPNKELIERIKNTDIHINVKYQKKRVKTSDVKEIENPVAQYYIEGYIEE